MQSIGRAAVATGWRKTVADGVTEPVARAIHVRTERVRALIGLAFLALSVKYVAGTVRRFARRT